MSRLPYCRSSSSLLGDGSHDAIGQAACSGEAANVVPTHPRSKSLGDLLTKGSTEIETRQDQRRLREKRACRATCYKRRHRYPPPFPREPYGSGRYVWHSSPIAASIIIWAAILEDGR